MLIDGHSHWYPEEYLQLLERRSERPRVIRQNGRRFLDLFPEPDALQPVSASFHAVEAKLEYMDRGGISRAVISLGNPWLEFLEPGAAVDWAPRLNDELDRLCRASSGRLFGLAVLALQDVDAAIAEVERLQELPSLRGVVIPAKPQGGPIDDPRWLPLWQALDRADLPISLHPQETVGEADLAGHGALLYLALGFPFETTTAVARLAASGLLDRFPRLRWILPHGGGTVPYLMGRLKHLGRVTGRPFPQGSVNLWCDALVYDPVALRFLVEQVGSQHLIYGTDHPFAPPDPDLIRRVLREADLAPADAERIACRNAERLFGLPPDPTT